MREIMHLTPAQSFGKSLKTAMEFKSKVLLRVNSTFFVDKSDKKLTLSEQKL
jgi:hypothetical protein